MREFEIRPARPKDVETVARISVDAFGEYAPSAGPHAYELCRAAGARTLMARMKKRIVGFAVISARGRSASLDAIAVVARERGKGIGSALLQAAEEEARRAGAPALVLVTADSNLAALDLFLRAGYRITARLERFYARGQNAVKMEKRFT
jgi:[ribosomal protein S18]-alanine N-acetyltransferase